MKALDYDGTDHLIDKIYDALNSGGSADYIVEEGRSGIWIYKKWASGIAECWGRQSATIDVTRAWGDGYISQNLIGGDALPFTFYSIESAFVQNNNLNGMVMSNTDVSTTNAPSFFIYRPYATQASVTVRFSYEIKGLWKEFTPSVSVGHIDLVGYDVVTGTNPITIPATNSWRFAVISAYVNTGSYVATYQTIITNNQTFSTAVLLLGGYDIGGNDFGLCNVNINMNVNGGTMTLRNFYYAGQNFKSGANLGIRYYGTK